MSEARIRMTGRRTDKSHRKLAVTGVEVREDLEEFGYHVSRHAVTYEKYLEIAASVGDVVASHDVRVRAHSKRMVSSPMMIPFHNDCSAFAEYIGWYCVNPGGSVIPTLLLETGLVLSRLREEAIRILQEVGVTEPGCERVPLLRYERGRFILYNLPWYIVPSGAEARIALDELQCCVKEEAEKSAIAVPLLEGQFCFVDDRRFMHGRADLADAPARHLIRTWCKCPQVS
jgi:hypothetical protein